MSVSISRADILSILKNPLFWICLLFAIRLYHVNYPPMGAHIMRQTMTLGVARNYLEWDANFFRPRTLLCDSRTGIFAQEFPIFNYLIFLGWKIFGDENWVFRIINLIATSFGLYWFYHIVKRILNDRAALFAMIMFGCSIAFSYTWKAMPDTFSVSIALGGVYYGWNCLTQPTPGWKSWTLFFLFSALGILSKIPAASTLALLVYPFFSKDVIQRNKLPVILLGTAAIGLMAAWYFLWVPWAERTYGHYLFYPQSLKEGWKQIVDAGYGTYERFEALAFQSRVIFYICVAGLLTLLVRRDRVLLILSWIFSSVVFLYFMIKAGFVFSSHEYYIIPYIPILAILGSYAIDYWLPRRDWLTLTIAIIIACIELYPQMNSFFLNTEEQKYLRLESLCDKYIEKDAKILTSWHDGSVVMLYFCHRKGWSDDERWMDEDWIAGEANVGMEYVVVERFRASKMLSLPIVYQDQDFIIYKTIAVH
jgi:4-amino-4-deoxy-L-arabinose transferase-like glycosyltransferase